MRVRNLALACVAVMACVMPARADVILNYHLSTFNPPTNGDTLATGTQIPTPDSPLGTALTGPGVATPNSAANPLVFNAGETKYIQIAIQANATPPTSVNGQNQLNWTTANNGNTMTAFGFDFRYPLSLVINPFTPPVAPLLNQNNTNARSQSGPQPTDGGSGGPSGYFFSTGHPITYTMYNMGGTAMTGLDTAIGLGTGVSGFLSDTLIATLKIRAGSVGGDGTITMLDLNSSPTAAGFGLIDGTNLDDIIFAPAHAGFPLFIRVVAIPEPSSMCLAGLAVVGFGWRKLRRKAPAAA